MMQTMPMRWRSSLIALALTGCFDDPEPMTSSDDAADDTSTTGDTGDDLMLGGTWNGSWFHEQDTGGLHLQLYHAGGPMVTGTATFDVVEWFQCLTEANLNATLDGDQLTGTLVSAD